MGQSRRAWDRAGKRQGEHAPTAPCSFLQILPFPHCCFLSLQAMAAGYSCGQQCPEQPRVEKRVSEVKLSGAAVGAASQAGAAVGLPSTGMDLPPLLSCSKALGTTSSGGQSSTVSLSLSSCLLCHQLSSTEMVLFLVTHLAAL